jgi:hypothetical protein
MIAALICVVSIMTFAQFFVSYTRTILTSVGGIELSPRVRELVGIADGPISSADFGRLLQLVHLCSEGRDDRADIRAVGAYYRALRFVDLSVRPLAPRISEWLERERQRCSHFAAVALDRRIAHNMSIYGRQITEGL